MNIYTVQSIGLWMMLFGACAWMIVGFVIIAVSNSGAKAFDKYGTFTKWWFGIALALSVSPYLLTWMR